MLEKKILDPIQNWPSKPKGMQFSEQNVMINFIKRWAKIQKDPINKITFTIIQGLNE